jgi:hypothetical protein
MIARINHEHAEREALEQQRQGLLKKKQGLIADNKKRKDDLANLDKDLEKFIDVSHPPAQLMLPLLTVLDFRLRSQSRKHLKRNTEARHRRLSKALRDNITSRKRGAECYLEHTRFPRETSQLKSSAGFGAIVRSPEPANMQCI